MLTVPCQRMDASAMHSLKENDTFWHAALTSPPPSNYSPGLVLLLKKFLLKAHKQGSTSRAVLCYERTVHIGREFWDAGWGCGYRNFMMACAALMDQSFQPLYFPLLDHPIGPGIRNLQVWIESAWKAGFDVEGSTELRKLVGTKKWIGVSDLWVALSWRGIPVELADFDLQNKPRGAKVVINWVVRYFSPKAQATSSSNKLDALVGASPIVVTDRMPLILQYKGHSVTIVGYEVSKKGTIYLLCFDPSRTYNKATRDAAITLFRSGPSDASAWGEKLNQSGSNPGCSATHPIVIDDAESGNVGSLEHPSRLLAQFRLNLEKMQKKQYQILYFPMTEPLTEFEKLQRRVVRSTKVC